MRRLLALITLTSLFWAGCSGEDNAKEKPPEQKAKHEVIP